MMEHSDQEVRNAAEALLRSTDIHPNPHVQTPNLDMSHSHSINTIPSIRQEYVFTDDFFAGYRINGRMSNVRRFFCMFVTFDLLFTGLMWLICIMLHGENIMVALKDQVLHYNIHTSLFDIAMVALCRFTILLLFYALLYINHWIIIALSTSGTCAFLIGKVFFYDWQKSNQPVFEVLLVLASFILAWGEAWFLDFRVLPQEVQASQFIISSPDSERAPLLQHYIQSLPSAYTESVGNFYSPMDSPIGSIRRFDVANYPRIASRPLTREQEDAYKNLANTTFNEAMDIFRNTSWKHSKRSADGDDVYVMESSPVGKVYLLKGILNVSPDYALQELFYKVDSFSEWNKTCVEAYKLQTVDEHTDITYQVSREGAGGLIARREFVTLRHWKLLDDHRYFLAYKKTDHPAMPVAPSNKYIRGEMGIGCYVLSPIPGEDDKCLFQWLINININGQVPKFVLSTALIGTMFDFVNAFRTQLKKQKGEKS